MFDESMPFVEKVAYFKRRVNGHTSLQAVQNMRRQYLSGVIESVDASSLRIHDLRTGRTVDVLICDIEEAR